MDCNRKQDANETSFENQSVRVEQVITDDPKILKKQSSMYKSIQEWLFDLCDKDNPNTSITSYHFVVFDKDNDFDITLFGMKSWPQGNSPATGIDYKPSSNHFHVDKTKDDKSFNTQTIDSIKDQLIAFTKTDKFKTSFFAKSNFIDLNVDDEEKVIWSK